MAGIWRHVGDFFLVIIEVQLLMWSAVWGNEDGF